MPNLNSLFVQDQERLLGPIDSTGRLRGKFSALVKKDWIPDGTGFNWQSVQSERTKPSTTPTWATIQANDGSTNTCVPTAATVNSATTVRDYSAYQTALESEDICLDDARHSYRWTEQVAMKRENFVNNVFDTWDDRDRSKYVEIGKYKYIADNGLSYTSGSTSFPLVEPTNYATMNLLRAFYIRLIQDGADKAHGAYGMRNGRPIFMALMDSETQANIIQTDSGTRQDMNYSYMGKETRNPIIDTWGIDREYGGFYMCSDDKMPRYDFVGGAWVERPFYANVATTEGNSAEVNPDYTNAEYTDIIIFNPMVMTREMVKPLTTVGSDTRFKAVDYNGDARWVNFPTDDNPDESIGYWRAILKAAYRPRLTRYGITVRVSRCTDQLYSFSSCTG